ncbi:hypothetical protein PMEGAPR185_06150 [Priestia megaterium]
MVELIVHKRLYIPIWIEQWKFYNGYTSYIETRGVVYENMEIKYKFRK